MIPKFCICLPRSPSPGVVLHLAVFNRHGALYCLLERQNRFILRHLVSLLKTPIP